MQTIWFIRHGESEANAGLRSAAPAKVPITPRGQWQALAVARAFPQSPDLIVRSPYVRTHQTAAPTHERFPHVPTEEWPVQEFTYLGLPHDCLTTRAERRPLVLAYWERCDPAYCAGNGAESFLALMVRVQQCVARLRGRSESFIAVFSHGHFIKTLLWWLLVQPAEIGASEMRACRQFLVGLRTPNGAILPLYRAADDGFLIGSMRTQHLEPRPPNDTY